MAFVEFRYFLLSCLLGSSFLLSRHHSHFPLSSFWDLHRKRVRERERERERETSARALPTLAEESALKFPKRACGHALPASTPTLTTTSFVHRCLLFGIEIRRFELLFRIWPLTYSVTTLFNVGLECQEWPQPPRIFTIACFRPKSFVFSQPLMIEEEYCRPKNFWFNQFSFESK